MAVNLRDERLHFGLLGFLATVSVLSLSLNGYFLWTRYSDRILDYLARGRTPAPVTAADHVRGPGQAAATVIVYSDLQCPFCRELYQTMKTVAATDSFRWVHRHFPLAGHPLAMQYAEAAECAGAQGRFWEMADRLYAPTSGLTVDQLTDIARTLDVDVVRFRGCMDKHEGRAAVLAQKEDGGRLRISGTPTFFVNGRRVDGLIASAELKRLLRQGTPVARK